MRLRTVIWASFAIVTTHIAAANTTSATELNAEGLHHMCMSKTSEVARLGCLSYLRGFADGFSRAQSAYPEGTAVLCIPKDAVDGQALDIVSTYLAGHPELGEKSASHVTLIALLARFSCSQ